MWTALAANRISMAPNAWFGIGFVDAPWNHSTCHRTRANITQLLPPELSCQILDNRCMELTPINPKPASNITG